VSTPTFITLGPAGTCHEHALLRYIEFQGLEDAHVDLVGDLLEGVERVRAQENAFLIQCSAHPDVHLITERYRHEVFVVDTFLYPAKEMALLARGDVEQPKTLGIVPAALGYVDLERFDTVVQEAANPIVAANLLAGKYDAGVTIAAYAEQHPDALRVLERYGEVDTTWVVYGRRRRFHGQLIGHYIPWMFTEDPEPVHTLELAGDGHGAR
jgi:hypothetical protein